MPGRALAVGLAGALVAGCGLRVSGPAGLAEDGIAIALYPGPVDSRPGRAGPRGYAIVDDRRWIEVGDGELIIDRIDPGVALESLVIEPAGAPLGAASAGDRLAVGRCLRDRLGEDAAAPLLRCAVRGRPGRHLVRVLYVAPMLGYRAHHDVAMAAPDRARVVSRFVVDTPAWAAWRSRAELTIWSGPPGGDRPPHALVRGTAVLDGSTAVIAAPAREVGAALRWVYDGAVRAVGEADPRERRWHHGSQPAVWVWLELAAPLAPASVHARIALPGEPVRDITVPAAARRPTASGVRLPLWIDPELHGRRDRRTDGPDGGELTDTLVLSIGNTGGAPREVWIEEQLRPIGRRSLVGAWPGSASIVHHTLWLRLTVAPGAVARGGFEVHYEL